MLFAVAVAAAVTMFAAPGPTDDVTAMIFLRLHSLLVLALPDLQMMCLLCKCLPQTKDVSVSRKHYHTLYKRMLLSVV